MQRSTRKRAKAEDVLEVYISSGERGELPLLHSGGSVGRPLNPMRLAEIRKCPECRLQPVVYLTLKKIPA